MRFGKKHLLAGAILLTTLVLYVLAGLSLALLEPAAAPANAKLSVNGLPAVIPGLGRVPEAEPMRLRDVAPQEAVAINAAVPVSDLPNPQAKPFSITFATSSDRLRAIECLTAAVYYEAATEPLDGQRAVAQVVLNRARHPAYPKSVCGVVFQGHERATGCQFTFTCDGAIRRTPIASIWARARHVAEQALAGKVYAPVGWATHYHTNWVVPYWSSSLTKLANVGTHIFYRWEGNWGRAPAFRFGPNGREPQFAAMRPLTSDPTSLAGAVELVSVPTPDEAAAAAAQAALAAGTLPSVDAAVKPATPGEDISKRPVIRRYEPMTREAATAAAMARTKEPASSSLHWALSGLPDKEAAPLGKKVANDAAPAAAPPKCLEGVRKLPAAGDGKAQTQAC
ncbi:MAG TPA: cell wall hydrolase [Allosphingosinicella sp.]|jgi:spore germination cell wall hydrolase CwlJ-like protein